MKKTTLLYLLTLLGFCFNAEAQKRSISEFMQSAGFEMSVDNKWTNQTGAIVETEGDNVKAFHAPQIHSWRLVFGDGSKLGCTFNVKAGDILSFENDTLTLPGGVKFFLLSTEEHAMTSRGIVKSAIFNKERDLLYASDIKIIEPESYSIGSLIKGEEERALDKHGNYVDLVMAERQVQAEKQKKADATWEKAKAKNQEDIQNGAYANYEEYCRKYGKDKIDALINGDIVIGVPWELTARMIEKRSLYTHKKVKTRAYWDEYNVKPFMLPVGDWYEFYKVYVHTETGLVTGWRKCNGFNKAN